MLPWPRAGATRFEAVDGVVAGGGAGALQNAPRRDVLKLITQLLDVKELGRCARTSSVLAAAAVSGFEARATATRVSFATRTWRKLCRKAMSFDRRPRDGGEETAALQCTPTTRSGGPSSRTSGSTACQCRSGWTSRFFTEY